MSSPAPLGMFIIGFIIFALYMWGLLTILLGVIRNKEEFNNDPEIQEYYRRLEVKDRRKKRVKKNERQKV